MGGSHNSREELKEFQQRSVNFTEEVEEVGRSHIVKEGAEPRYWSSLELWDHPASWSSSLKLRDLCWTYCICDRRLILEVEGPLLDVELWDHPLAWTSSFEFWDLPASRPAILQCSVDH